MVLIAFILAIYDMIDVLLKVKGGIVMLLMTPCGHHYSFFIKDVDFRPHKISLSHYVLIQNNMKTSLNFIHHFGVHFYFYL